MQVYGCRYGVGKSLRTICKNCLRLLVKSISTMMSIIFLGINGVGMLPIQTESLELEHKHIVSCDWFLSCVIKCHRTLFLVCYPSSRQIK